MRRYHRFLSYCRAGEPQAAAKERTVERGIKDFVRQVRS